MAMLYLPSAAFQSTVATPLSLKPCWRVLTEYSSWADGARLQGCLKLGCSPCSAFSAAAVMPGSAAQTAALASASVNNGAVIRREMVRILFPVLGDLGDGLGGQRAARFGVADLDRIPVHARRQPDVELGRITAGTRRPAQMPGDDGTHLSVQRFLADQLEAEQVAVRSSPTRMSTALLNWLMSAWPMPPSWNGTVASSCAPASSGKVCSDAEKLMVPASRLKWVAVCAWVARFSVAVSGAMP